jgi:hypothetical protein
MKANKFSLQQHQYRSLLIVALVIFADRYRMSKKEISSRLISFTSHKQLRVVYS